MTAPASRAGDGFAGKPAAPIAVLAAIGTLPGFLGSSMHNEASLDMDEALPGRDISEVPDP